MSNQVNKVILLSSSKAERIGTSDKMSVIINAAAVDIENNFLPLQSLKVFIDGVLVDTTISDASGELSISYQRDYIPDTETILYVEHEASNIKSPKKLLPVWWIRDTPLKKKEELKKIEVVNIEVITIEPPRVTISPISKWEAIVAMRESWLNLGKPEYLPFADDIDVVMQAVKQNGLALEFASRRLRKKKKIVIVVVENNGMALQFTSLKIKNDKEVVLCAVRDNWYALVHASENLKSDREIAEAAIINNPYAIACVSAKIRKDPYIENIYKISRDISK